MLGKFFLASLVLTSTCCAAPIAASAAGWRDVGRISSADQPGQVVGQGVDGQGVYSALFRPIVGEVEYELSEFRAIFGPVQERERRPGGRVVARPGFDTTDAVLAVAPGGERIAASAVGSEGDMRVEVRRRLPGTNWSPPQTVAQNQSRVSDLDVDVAPTGEAVVSWYDERPLTQNSNRDTILMAAARPARATTFEPAEALERVESHGIDVEMDARGNAMAAWIDASAEHALRFARRPAGGAWSAPQSLHGPRRAQGNFAEDLLDIAPNGRVVLAWSVAADEEASSSVPTVALGSTTGAIGAPTMLSEEGGDIAAATDGSLVAITWAQRSAPNARHRAVLVQADGDPASAPVRTISGSGVPFGGGDVAVAKGRATFAWHRRVVGPKVIEARSATADGRFTRTQTLSTRKDTSNNVLVTTSSRGEPWVTWAGQRRKDSSTSAVYTAKASARTGVFERSQIFARGPRGELPLVSGRHGTMLAPVVRDGDIYLRAYGKR